MFMPPNILTIAGSDSGGGAGIQGDIKTIMSLGCYGLTVITALTAQNGLGVAGIEAPNPEFVRLQLETVLAGFPVKAAKTGMLFSAAIISAIAPVLEKRDYPLVVDPVSISQSGSPLLEADAVEALKTRILPGCDLVTPNLPEAEMLASMKINNQEDVLAAAKKITGFGAKAALIKGGHMAGAITVTDYLYIPGQEMKALPQARVDTANNHGTGCALSAAIACFLGREFPLEAAVPRAQTWLNKALRAAYAPGKGFGPINHAVAG